MRWHDHLIDAEERGAPDGVRMVVATGLVKKGQDSGGGTRQYGGPLGKVEPCPVGACVGEASRQG